ncbi:hypothetical protein ABZX98_22640 [Streptomyces sp. NPDC002992]
MATAHTRAEPDADVVVADRAVASAQAADGIVEFAAGVRRPRAVSG